MGHLFTAPSRRANTILRLFGAAAFLLLANLAFSQGFNDVKILEDLSTKTWKPAVELNTSLAEEITRTETTLGAPNLQPADKSLFTAYRRMLGYIQTSTQAGSPVGESITEAYKKVLDEQPHDPALQDLPFDALVNDVLPYLIESLGEVPQYIPARL